MINGIDESIVRCVTALDDTPTQTGRELKEVFDQDSVNLAEYINNNLVPAVNENETEIGRHSISINGIEEELENLETDVNKIKDSGYITTRTLQATNITIKGYDQASGTISNTLSGYTCLGVVGFSLTNYSGDKISNIFPYRININGNWALGNCEGEDVKATITVTYLYIKN